MFHPTNSNHFLAQGGNYTRVMLFSQNNGTAWGSWTKELDRNNLEGVEDKEFDRDPDGTEYDNPWYVLISSPKPQPFAYKSDEELTQIGGHGH
jgi:hypothetical protein